MGWKTMEVLGISGSPHVDGLSKKLMDEALSGAKGAGANIERVHIPEWNIEPCIGCDTPCWEEMVCSLDDDGLELRKMMEDYDALIFSAPVYFLSVNGMAKNFMDRMRYYGENGKPALPIAVAGGTGKGCISTLQEISKWLILLGYRPLIPVPVTRYNLQITLAEAKERGKKIVERDRIPFSNLHEKIKEYESLPYMDWTMLDEMKYLAEICIHGIVRKGKPELTNEPREKLEKAKSLLKRGEHEEGSELIVRAQEESLKIFDNLPSC